MSDQSKGEMPIDMARQHRLEDTPEHHGTSKQQQLSSMKKE